MCLSGLGGGSGNRLGIGGGDKGGSGKSPSCGKKTVAGLILNGCIYECAGNIQGTGTCATERTTKKSMACGSCVGEYYGGQCR